MPAYASPTPPRSGDVAGTLRLLTYLALSVALIVLDHRGDVLTQVRAQANLAVQPLWWLAGLPGRLGDSVRGDAEIGRASGRERVLQYVWISGVAGSLKKKKKK